MNYSKDNPKAILLILIGMSVFALQDTFIKILSDDTNIYLIYFVRSLLGLSVIFIYLKIKKIPIVFKDSLPTIYFIKNC